jgi:uncharacterized OsmC-like protein
MNEIATGLARRVSVSSLEDGAFEWTNSAAHGRLRRDGPEAVHAVDLLLASLGMCVAGTIHAFADNHGINALESVSVDVVGTEATSPSRLTNATLKIRLTGSLSHDDIVRLKRAGEHCKIHTTLAQGVIVRID